jgi:hypothetical protein
MTKYEMIIQIKNEIKATSQILRENKKAYRTNQSLNARGQTEGYLDFQLYPFQIGKICKDDITEVDGKFFYKTEKSWSWRINWDIASAKCHLTCLHIVYNSLRNKKLHCHEEKRNDYYVQNFKSYFEGIQSQLTEEQDAHVSCPTSA